MVRVLRRNSSDQIRGRYFIDLSFGSLPCEGRGGLGRGAFRIGSSRGHPLPASPCLRRGRSHVMRASPVPPACPCPRSEEHTSELQSLMRISYAVFCLTKKKQQKIKQNLKT